MKKYSYHLFPLPLIILSCIFLIIALAGIYMSFDTVINEKSLKETGLWLALIIVGLIILTFRSTIYIESGSDSILKESKLMGILMSKEKIKIPENCEKLILKRKIKTGTRYLFAVIPSNYRIESCDLFFYYKKGIVRLMNTDLKRAIKIAQWIKNNLNLEYTIE